MALAVGLAAAQAQAWLDAYCRNVAYSQPAAFWVKLHTAIPGAAGTNGPATDTTRKQATFSAAAADGTITTSGSLDWTNLATADPDVLSHVSFWTASSGGTFLGSAALTSTKTVSDGDNFTIATGDLDISISPIATT